MIKIDILLYCLLYIAIGIVFLVFLIKKSKEFSPAYKGFMFGMLLYYIIIPIICLLNAEGLNIVELAKGKYCTNSIQRFIIDGENWKKIYSIFLLVITFISFQVSYKLAGRIKNKDFNPEKIIRLVKVITYFTFVVGVISIIVIVFSFGGIGKALSNAEYLRAFDTNLEDIGMDASVGFFTFLAKLIIVSPFTLTYLINYGEESKRKRYKIMLAVAMILSIFYFLFNAGRAPLLLFIICFLYLIIHKKIKHAWIVIIILGICALPLLDVLDSLYYYFNTGVLNLKNVNYLKYVFQFAFPYKNTLIVTDLTNQYGLRFGIDFVTSFLDLLPKVAFDASYVNTSEFIAGTEWRTLGGIPNDFITFSYIQFSILGTIILPCIMGIILKRIDMKLSGFKENSSKYLFSAAISVHVFSLIPYADFVSFIRGNFILIALALIILCSDRE